jgi:hypothetical protein
MGSTTRTYWNSSIFLSLSILLLRTTLQEKRRGSLLARRSSICTNVSLDSRSIIEKKRGRMNASCVCLVNGMDADRKSNCFLSFVTSKIQYLVMMDLQRQK